jgi:hypothetical protein
MRDATIMQNFVDTQQNSAGRHHPQPGDRLVEHPLAHSHAAIRTWLGHFVG